MRTTGCCRGVYGTWILDPGVAVAGSCTCTVCPSGVDSCMVIPGPTPGGTTNWIVCGVGCCCTGCDTGTGGARGAAGVYAISSDCPGATPSGIWKFISCPSGVVACSVCPAVAPGGRVTANVVGGDGAAAASRSASTLAINVVSSMSDRVSGEIRE